MTISDLGQWLVFVEKIFGPVHMQYDTKDANFKLKTKDDVIVAQWALRYGKPCEAWVRMDAIPEQKKKEVEKVLQNGRLDYIVSENG